MNKLIWITMTLAHRHDIGAITPEIGVALVFLQMAKCRKAPQIVDPRPRAEQLAECHPGDIGIGNAALAEIALIDFADNIPVGLVAVVDPP